MQLMIFKFWIALTLYNSILICSCRGGALPYLQQGPSQNQLFNRSPSSSYGVPPPLPPPPPLGLQRHGGLQSVPSTLNIGTRQQPVILGPSSSSPSSSLPLFTSHRQQVQSRVAQPHNSYLAPQQSQQQTLLQPVSSYQTRPSSALPSGDFNKIGHLQPQPLHQHSGIFAGQPEHPIVYHMPIASIPLIPPTSLPPLQPGPTGTRILSATDDNIASNHIVVENYSTQDSDSFLTGAKNSTLYAAQLLAKSLLEASHENDYGSGQQLNKTDLVVVKTQKKAYIIPMNLAGKRLDQSQAQELYQNRDKLPVAYTVNQFLFIIKPENVNFLNKLV